MADPKEAEKEPEPPPLEHPDVRREERDVWPRPLIAVALVVPVLAAIGFCLIWAIFQFGLRYERSVKFSKYPLAPAPSSSLPAEPRLEPLNRIAGNAPANDFDRQLAQETRLTTFGSASEKGFIHIPIQVAIKLVVSQLPVRKPAAKKLADDNGLRFGGGPNSGRVFEEESP
jgi:hypothetical protein